MSKSSNKRLSSLLFVFVVSVSLVSADLVVLAQNTQDDTTRGAQMTSNTQTENTTSGNTSGRRRRGRRRGGNTNAAAGAEMTGNASMTTEQGNTSMTAEANANMTTTTGGRRRRRGRRRGAGAGANMTGNMTAGTTMTGNVSGGEQTDLSGTYTGTVDYPEGGLSGDATLTITGNNFTLTAGSTTQTGRVTAVTTRGYTAVTMMFGDLTPPAAGQAPAPLPAVSLRARRMGTRVTLNSVPGEKRHFSFSVTGGRVGGRRRRRGGGAGMTTTTGEVSGNANMAGNANMTTGETGTTGGGNANMSTGGRRRRRSRRRGGNANMNGGNANMGGGNANNTNQ